MTVPRLAFFYFSGWDMPWLREQSLVSFRKHHPDYQVILGSPENRQVPPGVTLARDRVTSSSLPAAARSDLWRYRMLAEHGGVYADTDVIFVRRVDQLFQDAAKDAWITQDLGTGVPGTGRMRLERGISWRTRLSIGVLAARPGSRFFTTAAAIAAVTPSSHDYQSHGTKLLARNWSALNGPSVGQIPASAFYRHGSNEDYVRDLWHRPDDVRPHEYGIHWYGGSRATEIFLEARSVADLPDCVVRRAILHG